MPDVLERLGRETLILEGAMGTMLQRAGMLPGTCPEMLNVTAPEMVGDVHRLYRLAGADCTTANSFGGSRPKLAEHGYGDRVEEYNRAAVRVAKRWGAPHILADVGPTGLVLEPLGEATFDEVFDIFAEQVAALAAENPDAIFFETFTDIAEVRCGILAARSVTDVPVFASVTFGANGRMDLSGTGPATAAVILEAAGVSAVGMNCGLGPEQMVPLVREMASATNLPVIVQPNAGMPRLDEEGHTVFPGSPEDLEAAARLYIEAGAAAVGGCCGTTPAYIAALLDAVGDRRVHLHGPSEPRCVIAGPRCHRIIGGGAPIAAVGERINPTGKPALADSLREGSMSVVRAFGVDQEHAGADALDVNVGAAGIDGPTVLPVAVNALVASVGLPLVLDTTDPDALEAALRVYPGRALINSVNGVESSMDSVLPLAARYGAAVVVLALDDDGIPGTVEGRLAIVERVMHRARAAGLADEDLVVDGLVMTAAAEPDAPRTTLGVVAGAKEMGLRTLLGVSNVSHGLPMRPLLNAAFVTAAAVHGLDAAIVNPNDLVVMEALRTANADRASGEVPSIEQAWRLWDSAFDAAMAATQGGGEIETAVGEAATEQGAADRLMAAVARGDADGAPALVDAVIESGMPATDVIPEVLTPAIQTLGDAYGRGEVFLPQLIVSAEAMKAAVTRAKTHLPGSTGFEQGRVVFATVQGDIHSIGKDICVSLLESQGFEVTDLGVDVAPGTISRSAMDADAVCLSALMTTTLRAMSETIDAVQRSRPDLPVLVGGAVVTREWAESVGAGYADDAPGCVREVRAAIELKRDGG